MVFATFQRLPIYALREVTTMDRDFDRLTDAIYKLSGYVAWAILIGFAITILLSLAH
jgi:hypothetical protein